MTELMYEFASVDFRVVFRTSEVAHDRAKRTLTRRSGQTKRYQQSNHSLSARSALNLASPDYDIWPQLVRLASGTVCVILGCAYVPRSVHG